LSGRLFEIIIVECEECVMWEQVARSGSLRGALIGSLPLLRRAGVLILVLYSLLHSIVLTRNSILSLKPHLDPVTVVERRFEPLTARVSRTRYDRIGYVTNLPEDIRRAQYTLAPILVSDSANADLVVADLPEGSSIKDAVPDVGLFTVVDYGNGVFLLLRKAD
jgi:hypothetical protein